MIISKEYGRQAGCLTGKQLHGFKAPSNQRINAAGPNGRV